jgi:hypothetical protein
MHEHFSTFLTDYHYYIKNSFIVMKTVDIDARKSVYKENWRLRIDEHYLNFSFITHK